METRFWKTLNVKMIGLLLAVVVVILMVCGLFVYSDSDAGKLRKQLRQARQYLNDLKYEEAVAGFRDVLQTDPNENAAREGLKDAYLGWGSKLTDDGEFEEALAKLSEAGKYGATESELKPDKIRTYEVWTENLYASGKYDESIRKIETLKDEEIKSDDAIKTVLEKSRKAYIEELAENGSFNRVMEQLKLWLMENTGADRNTFFELIMDRCMEMLAEKDSYKDILRILEDMIAYFEKNREALGAGFADAELLKLRKSQTQYQESARQAEEKKRIAAAYEKLEKFKSEIPADQGIERVAIGQTIRAKSPYISGENEIIDKKKFVIDSDKENGYKEYVSWTDKRDRYIYYTIDTEKKILWECYEASDWLSEEIEGSPISYENQYEQVESEINAMSDEILDTLAKVLDEKYHLHLERQKAAIYTVGLTDDAPRVRAQECTWVIGCVLDDAYYRFALLLDHENQELFGRCTEVYALQDGEITIQSDERIDTFLKEGEDAERDEIRQAFLSVVKQKTGADLSDADLTFFTTGYFQSGHRGWEIYCTTKDKEEYQFSVAYMDGNTFRADCVRSVSGGLFEIGWLEGEIDP